MLARPLARCLGSALTRSIRPLRPPLLAPPLGGCRHLSVGWRTKSRGNAFPFYNHPKAGRQGVGRAPRKSWVHPSLAVSAIIGGNVLVYWGWFLSERRDKVFPFTRDLWQHFTCSARDLYDGRLHTLLTASFSHQSIYHLGLNMIALHAFGPVVAAAQGTAAFVAMYCCAAVLGSLLQVADMSNKKQHRLYTLGASGAVMSVLAFTVFNDPYKTVYFFGVLPLPAAAFGTVILGWELWGQSQGPPAPGQPVVAHAAHLGGALVGSAVWVLTRFRRRPPLRFH